MWKELRPAILITFVLTILTGIIVLSFTVGTTLTGLAFMMTEDQSR